MTTGVMWGGEPGPARLALWDDPQAVQAGAAPAPAEAATRLSAARARSELAVAPGSSGPAYPSMPVSSAFVPRGESFAPAGRGYARAAATVSSAPSGAPAAAKKPSTSSSGSKATPAKKSTKSTSSSSSGSSSSGVAFTTKELSFLKDKKLSIEEKLFRFTALLIQKNDQELVDAMNAYAGKKATSSSGSSSPTSGSGKSGTKTSSGSASGPGADARGVAKAVAKEVGGPLLAAAATAVGLPELAPAALSIGGTVAEGVVDVGAGLVEGATSFLGDLFGGSDDGPHRTEVRPAPAPAPAPASTTPGSAGTSGGGSSSASSGASTSSLAGASEIDEKLEMLQLQRLVEKQNSMFAALSNVLKSLHDSQMTAVQNIR